MFLNIGSYDPSGGCLGLDLKFEEKVNQHPHVLDVPDLGVGFEDDAVERCQISFWVNGG